MVIVHRLGPTGARYYLAAVGPGEADSPLVGEARGSWIGGASPDGPVTLAALAAYMPSGAGRLPGLDVMFSAPKSVSVLHALGGDDTAAHVRRAHDEAVRAGIDYLERHACRVRVRGRVEAAEGLVAATFRHRTSRADDPHLHTHVVVANMAISPDGRARALHTPALYEERRGAAATYHLVLRGALTASLGLRWEPPLRGRADAVEVPEEVRAAFSRRRTAVLDAAGSLAERKWAEHATRPPREGLVDYESLVFGWHRRARFCGWRAPEVFVARQPDPEPVRPSLLPGDDRWSRSDLVVALAGHWRDGAPAESVRDATERLLRSSCVVRRGRHFTTLDAEARVARVHASIARRRVVAGGAEALDAMSHDLGRRGSALVWIGRDAQAADLMRARAGIEAFGTADTATAIATLSPGGVVVIDVSARLPSAVLERALVLAARQHVEVVLGDAAVPTSQPRGARRPTAVRTLPGRTGDVTTAASPCDVAELALNGWLARRRLGEPAVIVAERNEVEALTWRARAALRTAGLLGDAEAHGFAVNDVVRFTRPRPSSAVSVHAQGEVVAIGASGIDVRLLGGDRTVHLRSDALGGVTHAHVVPPLTALLGGRGDVFVVGARTFAERHLDGAQLHRYVIDGWLEAHLRSLAHEPLRAAPSPRPFAPERRAFACEPLHGTPGSPVLVCEPLHGTPGSPAFVCEPLSAGREPPVVPSDGPIALARTPERSFAGRANGRDAGRSR